jgi:hypothetical protein
VLPLGNEQINSSIRKGEDKPNVAARKGAFKYRNWKYLSSVHLGKGPPSVEARKGAAKLNRKGAIKC